jgi:hypothetical protein
MMSCIRTARTRVSSVAEITACHYEHAVMSIVITNIPPDAMLLQAYFILVRIVGAFEGPMPSYKLTGIVLFPCYDFMRSPFWYFWREREFEITKKRKTSMTCSESLKKMYFFFNLRLSQR